jgi:hypothetical protein
MASIRLNGLEKIEVERANDEDGQIEITLTTEEGKVTITAGRTEDDALQLADTLGAGFNEAKELVEGWEERPDDHDGFIFTERHGWGAQLEGVRVKVPGAETRGLPCREAALYALAQAMAEKGSFPAAWYQERGIDVSVDSEIRAYHDDGGDQMRRPAAGQYHPDDEIQVDYDGDGDWSYAVVVFDTGHCVVFLAGEELHHKEDRTQVRPYQPEQG